MKLARPAEALDITNQSEIDSYRSLFTASAPETQLELDSGAIKIRLTNNGNVYATSTTSSTYIDVSQYSTLKQSDIVGAGKIVRFARNITYPIFGDELSSLIYESAKGKGTFESATKLSNVTLPESLLSIGEQSFSGCRQLSTIDLANVTYIAPSAFADVENLTSLYGQSVTSLGNYAFDGSSAIVEVQLPSLCSIGDFAFQDLSSLQYADFPKLTSIGKLAFKSCTGLIYANVSPSLETISEQCFTDDINLIGVENLRPRTIGLSAFSNCRSLIAIDLTQCQILSNYSFANCSSLTEACMYDIQAIGEGAFNGCTTLASISFGDQLSEIGASAFYSCSALTSDLIINPNVTIGENAFFGCSSLTHVFFKDVYIQQVRRLPNYPWGLDPSVISVDESVVPPLMVASDTARLDLREKIYDISSYVIASPDSVPIIDVTDQESLTEDLVTSRLEPYSREDDVVPILGDTVLSIDSNAFSTMPQLTSITIPETTTNVNSAAFRSDSALTEIEGIAVTYVGPSAFMGCYDLTEAVFSRLDQLDQAGYQFAECCRLSSIVLGNVTMLPEKTFYTCESLTSFFNTTVTAVNDYAFADCTSLVTITLPGATEISPVALAGCNSLTSASFESLTSLSPDIFADCSLLEQLAIPAVQLIPGCAFKDHYSIATIDINSATSIGELAFAECQSLETVVCHDLTAVEASAFIDDWQLTDICIDQLTYVGDCAFLRCSVLMADSLNQLRTANISSFAQCNLAKFTSFDQLTTVKPHAFEQCSNGRFTVLDNLSSVDEYGFAYDISLCPRSLTALAYVGDYAFYGCTALTAAIFPELTAIGKYAFAGCTSLNKITLRKDVMIGENAFAGCTKMQLYIPGAIYRDIVKMPGYPWGLAESQIAADQPTGLLVADGVTRHLLNETILDPVHSQAFWDDTLSNVFDYSDVNLVTSASVDADLADRRLTRDDVFVPILGDTTKYVRYGAFSDLTKVDKITLPTDIQWIADTAFANSDLMMEVNCENALLVGPSAFAFMDGLSSVVAQHARRVLDSTFYGCGALSSISLPACELISSYAFAECSSLTAFDLPSVTCVYNNAFDGCISLQTAVLSNVESCPENLFVDCSSLTSISLDSAKVVPENAISCAVNLARLNLDSVTDFDLNAFSQMTGLTDISLKSLTGYQQCNLFSIASSLVSVNVDSVDKICDRMFEYDLPDDIDYDTVELPLTTVNMKAALSIGDYAFAYQNSLVDINCDNVNHIGEYAFTYTALQSCAFPELTSLGQHSFEECYALTSFTAPMVSVLNPYTFAYDDGIISLSMTSLASIGDYALYYCSQLKDIDFKNISSIGNYGCADARSLTTIDSSAIRHVGDYAFAHCTGLTEIIFDLDESEYVPGMIGNNAFIGCTNLTSVTFSGVMLSTLKAEPNWPWGITDRKIIHAVKESQRLSLTAEVITQSIINDTLDSLDLDAADINQIDFSSNCKYIDEEAFSDAFTNLTSLNVPTTIQDVDINAFSTTSDLQVINFTNNNWSRVRRMGIYENVYFKNKLLVNNQPYNLNDKLILGGTSYWKADSYEYDFVVQKIMTNDKGIVYNAGFRYRDGQNVESAYRFLPIADLTKSEDTGILVQESFDDIENITSIEFAPEFQLSDINGTWSLRNAVSLSTIDISKCSEDVSSINDNTLRSLLGLTNDVQIIR